MHLLNILETDTSNRFAYFKSNSNSLKEMSLFVSFFFFCNTKFAFLLFGGEKKCWKKETKTDVFVFNLLTLQGLCLFGLIVRHCV